MILFLHGTDTYRSRKKLKELQDKFRKEVDPQGYNLAIIDCPNSSVEEIMKSVTTTAFLASKRMVVLELLSELELKKDEKKALADLFKRMLNDDTIIIVWEVALKAVEKKTALFKVLLSSPYVFEFQAWNQQEVAGWMMKQLQTESIGIDQDALAALAQIVGDNIWLASSESQKLLHYAKANQLSKISLKEVRLLSPQIHADDIFALVDAVSQGRVKEAIKRLYDQINSGSHELEILSMLFRQYRILEQVRSGLESGMSQQVVASTFKLHPFVVKKMSYQANRYKKEDIAKAYGLLLQADKDIKSAGLDPSLILGHQVASLFKN